MQPHVREAINVLLASRDGRVPASIMKQKIAKFFGLDTMEDARWREYNRAIKDEPLEQGIVVLPVKTDWVLNPDDEDLGLWLQATTGGLVTEGERINKVIGTARYRQSPSIQQFARRFERASEIYREIYEKIRAETGENLEPEDYKAE